MVIRTRLRMLADYLAATRNEIAVDEMFLGLSRVSAEDVGHWPRVPYWFSLAKRHPYLTITACRIAKIVWLGGGAAIFFLCEYLRFLHLRRSVRSVDLPSTEGVILGFSTRVCDVVKPSRFPAFPYAWLTLPWAPQKELPKDAQELPVLSILDALDFRYAFEDAITIAYRMRRNRHLSPWILQGYTAFRWFLVRRATDRLTGKLVTTEHFDRWAVLADRSVREKRRVTNCNDHLVLVQHGAMGALNPEKNGDIPSINLPTRLNQVDELHVYNNDEAAIFKSAVLAGRKTTRVLDLHFFKPVIELAGEKASSKINLLFVGHPLCESFQAEVFRQLTNKDVFEIFYKPHPKAPMSSAVTAVGWTLVADEKTFPRVDLLISYPSTLVVEYEGAGVPASIHPIDAGVDALSPFMDKTRSLINKINA